MNEAKNKAIADTMKATRLRRAGQECKVYFCKVDKSHLSRKSAKFLRMAFIEAKWFVNDIIASGDIFHADYRKKNPTVLKDGKTPEKRQIVYLPSQVRQALAEKIKQDIVNLSKLRKSGCRVGRLRFKREVRCLPLKQEGVTFKVVDAHHVRLQGNKGLIRLEGLGQIPEDAEIAKADLIHRAGNYYVNFVCFLPKEQRVKTGKAVGLDFGIETSVATSDGEKFDISIPEANRLRRLQRGRFSRKTKGSKNWVKATDRIAVEYDKVCNRKKDLRNKLVGKLTREYDVIVCQDEGIKEWHEGRYGRQVQRSCMGGIISDLKRKSETFVQVSKWFPSTQLCHVCGSRQAVGLNERTFVCRTCGSKEDRDVHSAINNLNEGLNNLRAMGNPEHVKTPAEGLASTDVALWDVSKLVSVKQEAIAL